MPVGAAYYFDSPAAAWAYMRGAYWTHVWGGIQPGLTHGTYGGLRVFTIIVPGTPDVDWHYAYDVGAGSPTVPLNYARQGAGWSYTYGVPGWTVPEVQATIALDALVELKMGVLNAVFGGIIGGTLIVSQPLILGNMSARIKHFGLSSPGYAGVDWEGVWHTNGGAAVFNSVNFAIQAEGSLALGAVQGQDISGIAESLAKIANTDTNIVLNHGGPIFSVQAREITGP